MPNTTMTGVAAILDERYGNRRLADGEEALRRLIAFFERCTRDAATRSR